jgi:hypothetical protein
VLVASTFSPNACLLEPFCWCEIPVPNQTGANGAVPDKAIDLVDEACANARVQLDSVPEEIDQLQRQKYRLQVEEQALSKEKDKVG